MYGVSMDGLYKLCLISYDSQSPVLDGIINVD